MFTSKSPTAAFDKWNLFSFFLLFFLFGPSVEMFMLTKVVGIVSV